MKQDLHPEYSEVNAKCSCGIALAVSSVLKENISIDVCSSCHSLYTGKQKTIDSGGRVELYRKRFGSKAKTMEIDVS